MDHLEARHLQKLQSRAEKSSKLALASSSTRGSGTDGPQSADRDIAAGTERKDVGLEKKDHPTKRPSSDDQDIFEGRTFHVSESDDLEKNQRTVFLANVSVEAVVSKVAKKTLLKHLISFNRRSEPVRNHGLVESLRFRSTPYRDQRLPRKAAFSAKDVMTSTSKSTHAYAIFNSREAARKAVKYLNGSIVLDRHLRIDSIAQPAKQDHKRCVYVGNLGFTDGNISSETGGRDSSAKNEVEAVGPSIDYEEGLWQTFGQFGQVEAVRLVRDKETQVGKGFAYVQFKDSNAVERALLCNNKSFPPMIPRKLRVCRARRPEKLEKRRSKRRKAERAFAAP